MSVTAIEHRIYLFFSFFAFLNVSWEDSCSKSFPNSISCHVLYECCLVVGFKVLKAASVKMAVLGVSIVRVLMMEEPSSSETPVDLHRTIWRYDPEHSRPCLDSLLPFLNALTSPRFRKDFLADFLLFYRAFL
jgi:hypothetical protein